MKIRTIALSACTTAGLLLAATTPVSARPATGLDVEFSGTSPEDCTAVVTSDDKDISNIVYELSDGTRIKIDDLPDDTTTYTIDDVTLKVWVKSGNNHGGTPGLGELFEPAVEECTFVPPPL